MRETVLLMGTEIGALVAWDRGPLNRPAPFAAQKIRTEPQCGRGVISFAIMQVSCSAACSASCRLGLTNGKTPGARMGCHTAHER
jgi:hypothetical protein